MTFKICIVGASFAGAILARQLEKYGNGVCEVVTLERALNIGDSETSTGLNLNSNGMATLRMLDPQLCDEMEKNGAPRTEMVACKMSGESLYRVPICRQGAEDNLAEYPGLRIRWKDASTCVREVCKSVRYGKRVTKYWFEKSGTKISIEVEDVKNPEIKETLTGFDMLIAADGRYSTIRQISFGEPAPALRADVVCNFRLLIDDDSNDLFEDMQLIYNDFPGIDAVEDEKEREILRASEEFQTCLTSVPRIGIMKMPASKTHDKDSLYIFGNFGIQGQVPDVAKSAAALTALYTPCKGPISPQCTYIVQKLQKYAQKLHWARMQEIPFEFKDKSGRVCFLGDAAHAMYPSLGQGATTAIEDAAIASQVIVSALFDHMKTKAEIDVVSLTNSIEAQISKRAAYVAEVSRICAEHLQCGAVEPLERDVRDWTVETPVSPRSADSKPLYTLPFRHLMRSLWRGHPKVSFSIKSSL